MGQRHYLLFCQQVALSACPASEHQLMVFATYLAVQGLTWQTIKVYLAAVHHLHLTLGLPFPGLDGPLPRLQLLLRGVCRIASKTHRAKPRLPITPSILRRVYSHLDSQPCTWDRRMIWAAMCVCFFGFLRSGEVCTPSPTEFDPFGCIFGQQGGTVMSLHSDQGFQD